MKRRVILAIILTCTTFILVSCSKEKPIKLTSYQQAIADSFFENRSLWETRDGEMKFCTQMEYLGSLQEDGSIVVRCAYSNYRSFEEIKPAPGAQLPVMISGNAKAFRVSPDGVSSLGDSEMTSMSKIFSPTERKLTSMSLHSAGYSCDNSDENKRQIIENFFQSLH